MNANPPTHSSVCPSRVIAALTSIWSRSIRSHSASQIAKQVLVGLIVSIVLLGTLVGAGTGVTIGSAESDTDASLESSEQAFTGATNETGVTLAGADTSSGPQDDFAVVQFENNTIVSGQSADETPEQAFITHTSNEGEDDEEEEYLIVASWDEDELLYLGDKLVEVGDDEGSHIERVDDSPDLQVQGTSTGIEVDPDDGTVQTDEGGDSKPIVIPGDGDEDDEEITYDNFDEPVLEPEITNVNEPAEGEDLVVNTTIDNLGYTHYTGDRTLSWDGDVIDRSVVNVNRGTQVNESFEIETEEGDSSIDELQFEINDGNDETEDTVDIEIAEAEVRISEFDTNTTISGDDLAIGVEIERIGDVPVDDMTVEFSVENETVETDDLEIDPGDTTTGEITYRTSSDDVPGLDVSVEIPEIGESAETEATILEPDDHEDNMGVSIDSDDIEIGNFSEELEVTGEFEYDGEIPDGETNIPTEFLVNGTVVEERDVTIDESPYEETFTWELNESTVPVSNVSLETPGGSDLEDFDRELSLEFDGLDEPFASSEPLTATVNVENDGEVPEFQNLTVGVDDSDNVESNATRSREILLNASETVEESFEFDLTPNASSGIELTANTSTVSETATANRSVFEAGDLELHGADEPYSGLSIAGNVTNTGALTDTQSIQYVLDGEVAAEDELTLEPDETELVSADIEPPDEDGEYAYGITTNNESLNASASAKGTATIENTSGPSLLDRISPVQFGVLVIGLLAVGALLVKYREDPEAFQSRANALTSGARKAVRSVVGGGETVVVENGLSRDATVRLRVRDSDEVVFLEDLRLADGEQREFACLPDSSEIEVGAGVDDIDSHAEIFQGKPNGVGVLLEPDGIRILEQ